MFEDRPDSKGMLDSGEMEARAGERCFLAMKGLEEEEAHLHCSTSSLIGRTQATLQQEVLTAQCGCTCKVVSGGPRRGQ